MKKKSDQSTATEKKRVAEKLRKPWEPKISKMDDGSILYQWDKPAIECIEYPSEIYPGNVRATGPRVTAMPIKGGALFQRYAELLGYVSPPLPHRERAYLNEPDPVKRAELALKECIEHEKICDKKKTEADRSRDIIRLPEGYAIIQACNFLRELHENNTVPDLNKMRCELVGRLLRDGLGEEFSLLRHTEEIHRTNAAERLKRTFSAVFDHLARAGKPLPPSDMGKTKFIDGQPREIILIEETLEIVSKEKRLPTKDELNRRWKERFKDTLAEYESQMPPSTWTDLLKSARLDDLPKKATW